MGILMLAVEGRQQLGGRQAECRRKPVLMLTKAPEMLKASIPATLVMWFIPESSELRLAIGGTEMLANLVGFSSPANNTS